MRITPRAKGKTSNLGIWRGPLQNQEGASAPLAPPPPPPAVPLLFVVHGSSARSPYLRVHHSVLHFHVEHPWETSLVHSFGTGGSRFVSVPFHVMNSDGSCLSLYLSVCLFVFLSICQSIYLKFVLLESREAAVPVQPDC